MAELFVRKTPIIPVRAMHLDLKGLPPTPERLIGLLKIARLARFNAVLVEWEDTFPWNCNRKLRGETWYQPDTVVNFCKTAEALGIEIIPLVQCLGHMETPLQLKQYAHLREQPKSTDCLNPLADGAGKLVLDMVKDVLSLGQPPRYFHLGGDEAWIFGTHPDTKAFIDKHGKAALYLQHVEPILDYLNKLGIRPILWHDMMKDWPEDALRALGRQCDLMVWGYTRTPDSMTTGHYRKEIIQRFAAADVPMWGGSAFKPGQGTGDNLADPDLRIQNNLGWAKTAREFRMRGVCATGWNRSSTPNVQYMPIDANLDILIACGVILHDGIPPKGGPASCVSALTALGEAQDFTARREAVCLFDNACNIAWDHIRNTGQYVAAHAVDPTRHASGLGTRMLQGIERALENARKAGAALQEHFEGLVAPIWIERLAASRTQAIADVHALLAEKVTELEAGA